jgi:hypothetical protein
MHASRRIVAFWGHVECHSCADQHPYEKSMPYRVPPPDPTPTRWASDPSPLPQPHQICGFNEFVRRRFQERLNRLCEQWTLKLFHS